jgi:hypothetical protein
MYLICKRAIQSDSNTNLLTSANDTFISTSKEVTPLILSHPV